ncbi:hypothetical protein M885DRAFT_517280 [Pelagophyceae sp. CCMP2097]|nr:hypothetical protein M885DRAFT_517280 [Pelagophyceae sp. CCMP2097]
MLRAPSVSSCASPGASVASPQASVASGASGAALVFDADVHASPAVRYRGARAPYLDKLAAAPHFPHADGALWRRTRTEPYVLPDLSHTGARSNLQPPPPMGLRPDGGVSCAMRYEIQQRVREQRQTAPRDMRAREQQRRAAKAAAASMHVGPGSTASRLEASYFASTLASPQGSQRSLAYSLADSLTRDAGSKASLSVSSRHRVKQAYSTASLATLMLDAEYGGARHG